MERGMWGTQERKDGWRSESPTAGQFILEMSARRPVPWALGVYIQFQVYSTL